jgi:hypothetical protein
LEPAHHDVCRAHRVGSVCNANCSPGGCRPNRGHDGEFDVRSRWRRLPRRTEGRVEVAPRPWGHGVCTVVHSRGGRWDRSRGGSGGGRGGSDGGRGGSGGSRGCGRWRGRWCSNNTALPADVVCVALWNSHTRVVPAVLTTVSVIAPSRSVRGATTHTDRERVAEQSATRSRWRSGGRCGWGCRRRCGGCRWRRSRWCGWRGHRSHRGRCRRLSSSCWWRDDAALVAGVGSTARVPVRVGLPWIAVTPTIRPV